MSYFLIHGDDRFRSPQEITVASSVGELEVSKRSSKAEKKQELSGHQRDSPNKCPKSFFIPGDLTAKLLLHAPHGWNGELEGIFPRPERLGIRRFRCHCGFDERWRW